MAGYLRKYVGTYRVKANIDDETGDFPRDENGILEPSFDDYYIDCGKYIQIRHATGSTLSCYINSKEKATNKLKKIYQDKIGIEYKEYKNDKYYEKLCQKLIDKNILKSAEILDFEGYFTFDAKEIDYFAKLLGARTNGANIQPLSSKNLPKKKYDIPKSDLDIYNKLIKKAPHKIMLIKDKERNIIDGLWIKDINNKFEKEIPKLLNKKSINIKKEIKLSGLKAKEYYHKIGLWNEYCNFIKERI